LYTTDRYRSGPPDIGEQALRRGSLESAPETAIVIAVSRQQPTLVLLAANVGLAGFALRRERIEFLLEPSSEDLRISRNVCG